MISNQEQKQMNVELLIDDLDDVSERPDAGHLSDRKVLLSPKLNMGNVSTRSTHCTLRSSIGSMMNSLVSTNRYGNEAEKLDWSKDKLLDDSHVRIIETCNKYKKEEAREHFDHIACNYEGMYLRMGYPDPKFVANFVAE